MLDANKDDLDILVDDAFFAAGLPIVSGTSSLDDEDIGWSIFGGYRFSPYFALEAGYVSLGEVAYRASGIVDPVGPTPPVAADLAMDISVKGPMLAAVGSAPLGERFDIHARGGVLFATIEADVSLRGGGASASESDDESSNDFFLGAGLGARLTDRWSVTLDYVLYKDLGEEDEIGESDVDFVTLGAVFKF